MQSYIILAKYTKCFQKYKFVYSKNTNLKYSYKIFNDFKLLILRY